MTSAKRRPADSDVYARRKERERERQREQARRGSDLGKIPKCRAPKRRAKAVASLRAACEIYFADRFSLKWAPHHLAELDHIERVIRFGGKQVIGDPRGDGKTTRLEVAIMWAVVIAQLHSYAALLTAIGKHAPKRITSIKTALLTNDRFAADFPEVCLPIRQMGGVANRCAAMHLDGDPVWPAAESVWAKHRIVLPTISSSGCSGSVIEAAGLLEATRGLNHATAAGKIIRPTVALIDDPQTNRSARSEIQTEEREQAISAGIIHLPGPDCDEISALASVTVIEPGDLADRMLDREQHPEWHGIKNRMLERFPDRMDLWEQYADIYRDELAEGGSGARASRFYKKHRKAMKEGARVSWEQRKEGATDAIECAMRKFIVDRESFFSEMQNEPESDTGDGEVEILSAAAIARKVSGHARYEIPPTAERLTFFVDVHKRLLYWAVCAWEPGFTGYIVDYDTWPKQSARYFDMRHARKTILSDPRITAGTLEGRIAQALDHCFGEICRRKWVRLDGAEIDLELGLVDANWGEMTQTVYDVCLQAKRKYGRKILPAHGMSFGPGKKPISRWDKGAKKGIFGEDWHVPPPGRGRALRHVLHDANRRKSFVQRRLATPAGDPGSLYLWHAPNNRHRMVAEHLTAETGTKVSGPWGDLVLWTLTPGRDNHLLDCLSGCCIAESILGGKLKVKLKPREAGDTKKGEKKRKKSRVSYY